MVLYKRSGEDIDRSLIHYYKCNDKFTDSTTLIDYKRFQDVSESTPGATLTSNPSGVNDALQFADDAIYVALNKGILAGAKKVTVSFWTTFPNVEGETQYPIRLGSSAVFNTGVQIGRVGIGEATEKQIISIIGQGALVCDTTVESDTWYHITWTQEGTTGRLYINGEFAEEKTTNAYINPVVAGNITNIGGHNGKLWKVRAYDRILTDGEISKLYRLKL